MKTLKFTFIFILVSILIPIQAQEASGVFNQHIFDTIQSYKRQYFTYIINYVQHETAVDKNGVIHSVVNDNYELFYLTSPDNGKTWTKEKLETGADGDIHLAMLGLLNQTTPLVVFSSNDYFNYGAATPYGKEFYRKTIVMVKTAGGWVSKTYFTPAGTSSSYNYGRIPFAITSTTDGKVEIIITRNGWWTYGGEIYCITIGYNGTVNWGDFVTVAKFNEGRVDRMTAWAGRMIEDANKNLHFVYYRQRPTSGQLNIEYQSRMGGTWQSPVNLKTVSQGNYHYMDIDADNNGKFYFAYVENNYPNSPVLWLDENKVSLSNMFEPFEAGDTAQTVQVVPLNNGSANIMVGIKSKYPRVFNYKDGTLKRIPGIMYKNKQDSADWKGRWFVKVQNASNFTDNENVIGFSGISKGSTTSGEVTTYHAYPRLFTEIDWDVNLSQKDIFASNTNKLQVYPNPASDCIYILNMLANATGKIYSLDGKEQVTFTYNGQNGIDISFLNKGIYLVYSNGRHAKFIKP